MSVLDILYTILIGPIQLVFETIFTIANRFTGNPGIAIIALSLIMNFLVLPLYRRADIMQEEARDIDLKLQKGVAHIKKNFTGDERMMVLQTYYRQNNYKPTDALNGSVSLLLEIPFFIAAYQFLSHLEMLEGVSLGPIVDLSAPDGILVLGGVAINILPVLMTVINIISSALYLKGFPLKTKIQLYSMALLFLVFLYTSPSGLVFYWTLNNIFSLFKNIFYKLKQPEKILSLLASISGVMISVYSILYVLEETIKGTMFIVLLGLCLQIPLMLRFNKFKNLFEKIKIKKQKPDKARFFLCGLFLTVFVGILIPSAVIAASPMEFMDVDYNPLWYLVSSGCFAIGTFLVWLRVFYWLASDSGKVIFDKIVWILCGIVVVNYMFFGTDFGTLFAELRYESGMDWGIMAQIYNLGILSLIAIIFIIIVMKLPKFVSTILFTAVLAIGFMSGNNIININKSIKEYEILVENGTLGKPHFNLSKTGKNVIVLMLDRAMNQYVPYMFNEKPELQEQFAGFTYYSNTISYGGHTNFATPALFGGYEYTPLEVNKRNTESLESKHNEALKVMPTIFNNNGYEVTVCDPPYAGYSWIPDLSIYDDLPDINTYNTEGEFSSPENDLTTIENRKRNFFCFGLMKSMPGFLQELMYNNGKYNQSSAYLEQEILDKYTATGMSSRFLDSYNVLLNLPEMSEIVEEDNNTFLMLTNNTTHEPALLREPEYEPAIYVDNREYSMENKERYVVNGKTMKMDTEEHIIHYQSNMAAFIQLGKWFDYLRENDVYDNTRIILVADHGRPLMQFDELFFNDSEGNILDLEFFYPLLMVKDFNSQEYQVSDELMTNADVPTLAINGIIDFPVNPYTGNKIDSTVKAEKLHYIIHSYETSTLKNNGNTFLPSQWIKFEGNNVWDKDSWAILGEETILPVDNK